VFSLLRSIHLMDPPHFPTRRSSDLVQLVVPAGEPNQEVKLVVVDEAGVRTVLRRILQPGTRISESIRSRGYTIIQVYIQGRLVRSEEHTSELQSRFDLVCRLLLEKK